MLLKAAKWKPLSPARHGAAAVEAATAAFLGALRGGATPIRGHCRAAAGAALQAVEALCRQRAKLPCRGSSLRGGSFPLSRHSFRE